MNYIGRVIERNTQTPIGGAKLSLDFQGTPPVVYTDAEGIYRFTVNLVGSSILRGQVWVEAEGYKRYNRFIELLPENTDLGDFRLEKTGDPAAEPNFWNKIPVPIGVAIITAVIGPIVVLVITKITTHKLPPLPIPTPTLWPFSPHPVTPQPQPSTVTLLRPAPSKPDQSGAGQTDIPDTSHRGTPQTKSPTNSQGNGSAPSKPDQSGAGQTNIPDTPKPPVVKEINFLEKAHNDDSASWSNGIDEIIFGEGDTDGSGEVNYLSGTKLEDGNSYDKALLTDPPSSESTGEIRGKFEVPSLRQGQHFQAEFGFPHNDNAQTNSVNVTVYFGDNLIFSDTKTYNGELASIDVDMSQYASEEPESLVLAVNTNGDSSEDQLLWVKAQLSVP